MVRDTTSGELDIKAPPPPPPPPPYDCEGEFAKLEATHAIHFAFDRWDLPETSHDLVKHVAEFLNDERCRDRRLIVKGHADYFGGRLYNEALSIRRAQAVIDALADAGLSPSRTTIRAYGESDPEDPERTADARAKNRRVVLSITREGAAQ